MTAIVVPVYGRWDLVLDAVRSVRQTCTADVIVVDDGSPSSCPGAVRILADVVWRLDDNSGFAHACNVGVNLADGHDIVVLLNSDCVTMPGWLEPLERTLARDEAAVAGPTIIRPDGAVQTTHVVVDFTEPPGLEARESSDERSTGPVQAVTGACMALWRDTFVDLGGFDETFDNGYEDVDYCLRARQAGFEVWHTSRSLVTHLGHQSGPQRWRSVNQNVSRLREKWAHA